MKSVDLKIMATKCLTFISQSHTFHGHLLFNPAILKETYNTTKLTLEDNPMARDDARMICSQNPIGLQGSLTNCEQQCLNQIRQAFMKVPEIGGKHIFCVNML